jgi:hypothetical protein
MFKDFDFILDAIRQLFLPNQKRQHCLPHLESILKGRHSRRLLPDPFRLEIENTTEKI